MQKPRAGLLGLMFDLYDIWPELKPRMATFGEALVTQLSPDVDVDFPGVCNTREQVDRAVASFEAAGYDLIIVVLLTYAPSHIALPALLRTKLPVLVFNTQELAAVTSEIQGPDTTHNHGMHGVQDLCNVLLRAGRPFEIVTGHYQDPAVLAEVTEWCRAAGAVKILRGLRIGLLGYPMEGMGDFGIDHTAFLTQIGVEVHHLAMREVSRLAQSAPVDAIQAQMEQDRALFKLDPAITLQEHEASSRLEWALRAILQSQRLDGLASHFTAVGEEAWLDTVPFLAAGKLMGEGYGFGGEGDVTSAAAVAFMTKLFGEANFTEMFTMDPPNQAILMMHMGEGNWRMARRDAPVHLLRSTLGLFDLRVDPLLLAFSLEPGDVTLLSLTTTGEGRLRFVITEGEVLDFPWVAELRRPNFKFKPASADGLYAFLSRFSKAGGSHHQALVYGHRAGQLEKLAALMGIECVRA